jgi:hypothetical protein
MEAGVIGSEYPSPAIKVRVNFQPSRRPILQREKSKSWLNRNIGVSRRWYNNFQRAVELAGCQTE